MTSDKVRKYIDMAYPICLDIERQKKHVSIILHKKRVVGVGTNSFGSTHPKAKQIGYPYDEMHSELDALLRVDKGLLKKRPKLDLINVRFNRFGELRMSRPCHMCMPWCQALFRTIWYTTDEGVFKLEET